MTVTLLSKGNWMRACHCLTEAEGNQVYPFNKVCLAQWAITDQIGVNKLTIYCELKRDIGLREYRLKEWHRLALYGNHKYTAFIFWVWLELGLKKYYSALKPRAFWSYFKVSDRHIGYDSNTHLIESNGSSAFGDWEEVMLLAKKGTESLWWLLIGSRD